MAAATLTSKGQITVPAEVRRSLGLEPGDRVLFVEDGGAFRILPANAPVTALKGMVGKPAKPVTPADMDTAIRRGAARAKPRP